MKLKTYILTLMLIVTVMGAAAAQVSVIEGSEFKENLLIEDTKLDLTGTGLFRYWGFKAYVGALYLENGSTVDEVLLDRAKRIELEYRRAIKGKDFGPATYKGLAKNLDPNAIDKLRSRIDYHNSLYEDVKPGDRYSLTYIPGRGTELALNNERKGVIEGADFAAAIFSLWVGPKPMNKSFKKQIMGLSR